MNQTQKQTPLEMEIELLMQKTEANILGLKNKRDSELEIVRIDLVRDHARAKNERDHALVESKHDITINAIWQKFLDELKKETRMRDETESAIQHVHNTDGRFREA